jgi:hypothetical protein
LKCLANNGLAVVSEYGCTTAFITLTTNINIPDITSQLFAGQSAFDRPDIVCQVFHQRLQAFIHNLKHGKYFGNRKCVFVMYSIEYQWRGLPHAHVCVRLENVPSADNREQCVQFIDEYVHATIPTGQDERSTIIRNLVKEHMIHKCVFAANGCLNKPLCEGGRCKNGYNTGVLVPETHFNEKGFPVYKRPQQNDLFVVPYNPDILKDWNGHVNVEYSETVNRVLYTYSYLYKGSKKTNLLLSNKVPSVRPERAQQNAEAIIQDQEREREHEEDKQQ